MFRERAQRLLGLLRRTLRRKRRFTLEECYQLLQLSETIIDHGRMLQSYFQCPMEHVMVEVAELAFRLRETPETVNDALVLLMGMGRSDPFEHGRWRLRLTGTLRGDANDKEASASA